MASQYSYGKAINQVIAKTISGIAILQTATRKYKTSM